MTTSPDPEDLTARARIRDAALAQFGEHGFDAATIRGIAAAAGVSSGLVRHHFGSKQALREACDEYLVRTIRRLNDQARTELEGGDDLTYLTASRFALGPNYQYIARALVDGSATELFDEMARLTEEWLAAADKLRPEPSESDITARARVITAMALCIPLLHEHISRGLGVDVLSAAGIPVLGRAMLDFYSNPLLSKEEAAKARAALDRMNPADLSSTQEQQDD
jgi:AcrR family transcriptional regulator